ncbi:MAG TPA: ACP S-malonyltransferase [Isosphaeraceae bacterium]|jgi:[acyl-carrier-protein] S-malonyltransferase|nr:ACP S-malonyltransferase [Isosphaeraceae bacterium]
MKDIETRWPNRLLALATRHRHFRLPHLDLASAPGGGTRAGQEEAKPDIKKRIGSAAFAFRGYDVANIGRTNELLAHPAYGPVVSKALDTASALCADATHKHVDLVEQVRSQRDSTLETFPEDVALIVAMEVTQVRLLEQFFEIPAHDAKLSFGYSIGELSSMVYGGVFELEQLLPIPLGLAQDCAELAADTTMGILFTRGPALPPPDVHRLCMAISSEGRGLIGPSAFLSPNTALVLGQGDSLDRLERAMGDFLPDKVMLRRNPNKWPPLHTPLVWQRNIPNRTAMAVYSIQGGHHKPTPAVYSCVTGSPSYDEYNSRELLTKWTDHPQRLWDVIYDTLASGVELVIHVGPQPNLIPATFSRLSNNVGKQLGGKYLQMLGRSVYSSVNRHAWLAHLLPQKAALLRAPFLEHVILEDWLLEQEVA